jgi:hypothetical protein
MRAPIWFRSIFFSIAGLEASPRRVSAALRLAFRNQLVSIADEQYTASVGEIIAMGEETHLAPGPKSIADILSEELGDEQTQELPVVGKTGPLESRLRADPSGAAGALCALSIGRRYS